jgi:DNA-binding MarR family transcriptional regulator
LDAKDARPGEATESGPIRPSAPRGGTKLARVLALLERDHGATIEDLIAATGWLAHTTRAALTGLRKRGYAVAIDRSDDKRGSFYRISAGGTGVVEGPTNSETARRKEQGRSEPQTDQAA